MDGFDSRKKGNEVKFVLEAQQEFKAEARRNKLLAQWVADILGKSEDETKAYIAAVILSDMEEAGDDDVFRKVRADLKAADSDITDIALREEMDKFMLQAREEIFNENNSA